jgi:hypothetical protein
MSFTAHSLVLIVSPEQSLELMAEGGEPQSAFEISESPLSVADDDGVLYSVLHALAQARAPEELKTFTRPWAPSNGSFQIQEGEHKELLKGETLKVALSAVEALLRDFESKPGEIAAVVATVLPYGESVKDVEEGLREAVSAPLPHSLEESTEAVESEFGNGDFPMSALVAWIRAFQMRLAYALESGNAVVHVVWC